MGISLLQPQSDEPQAVVPPTESDQQSLDDLKQKMGNLKVQIQEAAKTGQDSLKVEVKQRADLVTQDKQLVPLLEEAENALREFKDTMGQRLEIDKNNFQEFEELTELVAALRQKNEALAETYEKTLADLKTGFAQKLDQSVVQFEKDLEKMEQRRADLEAQHALQEYAANAARAQLEQWHKAAVSSLDPVKHQKTIDVLNLFGTLPNYSDYMFNLEQHRSQLGLFAFKQKAALDSLLNKRTFFTDADVKTQALNKLTQELGTANEAITRQVAEYKNFIIEPENPSPNSSPDASLSPAPKKKLL